MAQLREQRTQAQENRIAAILAKPVRVYTRAAQHDPHNPQGQGFDADERQCFYQRVAYIE
eukprot:5193554-Pyramimonas_sp.AAC.1